jgi:hypothetical protein
MRLFRYSSVGARERHEQAADDRVDDDHLRCGWPVNANGIGDERDKRSASGTACW